MSESLQNAITKVIAQESYQTRIKSAGIEQVKVKMTPVYQSCNTCYHPSLDETLSITFKETKSTPSPRLRQPSFHREGYFVLSIAPFWGCCGAATIHHATMDYYFQHRGLGRLFMEAVVEAFQDPSLDSRPGMLVGTTSSESSEFIFPILKGLGFHRAGRHTIENGNTGHPLMLWYKDLEVEYIGDEDEYDAEDDEDDSGVSTCDCPDCQPA